MLRPTWHTPENFAFIRDNFAARKPDSWIADQIGITKGQCISWRRANVGTRLQQTISRGAPRNTSPTRPSITDIHAGDAPDWKSQDGHDLFQKAWDANVPGREIEEYFNVNTESVRHRRIKMKLAPRGNRPIGYSGTNGWATPEGDADFIRAWQGKEHAIDIMARYGVGATALKTRRLMLGLADRNGSEVQRRSHKAAKAPVAKPEPLLRAYRDFVISAPNTRGTRDVSGRGGSVFNFRTFTRAASGTVSHEAGRCRWPLTCAEPTAGTFCAEHAGLLRARRAA
jgi:hypothetical protein